MHDTAQRPKPMIEPQLQLERHPTVFPKNTGALTFDLQTGKVWVTASDMNRPFEMVHCKVPELPESPTFSDVCEALKVWCAKHHIFSTYEPFSPDSGRTYTVDVSQSDYSKTERSLQLPSLNSAETVFDLIATAEVSDAGRTCFRVYPRAELPGLVASIGSSRATTPVGHVGEVIFEPRSGIFNDFAQWVALQGVGGVVRITTQQSAPRFTEVLLLPPP